MRTYIFTALERRAIHDFLDGKITASDRTIVQIRSRMKGFNALEGDIVLYVDLSDRLTEPEAAPST